MQVRSGCTTKEDLCIEAQERGKNFALIIKSSLVEGIFIDAKGIKKIVSVETIDKTICCIEWDIV